MRVVGQVRAASLQRGRDADPARRPEREDRFLAGVRRACAGPFGREAPRFSQVRVHGAAADVLLPTVTSRFAPNPFALYAERLERADAFPDQRREVRALSRVESSWTPAAKGDRPRVAILVSEPRALLPGRSDVVSRLADMLRSSGCEPVLVPPLADVLIGNDRGRVRSWVAELARSFDGVIGPGGADVHPRIYREPNTYSLRPNFPRDRFEAEVALAAMDSDCFMLGICRSHQLWNAARGGRLVQDVVEEGLSKISQQQEDCGIEDPQPFVVRDADGKVRFENRVQLDKESQTSAILDGEASVLTNSYHHQAVDRPGQGFRVTGVVRDEETGRDTIEVTEAWNAITTQFHPELMMNDDRFRRLSETVARRAHVFFLKKQLGSESMPGVDALLRAMRQQPEGAFVPADFEWAKNVLGPRLIGPAGTPMRW